MASQIRQATAAFAVTPQMPNVVDFINKLYGLFNLLDWIVEFNNHHRLMDQQKQELGALLGNARASSRKNSVSTDKLDTYLYLLE